ncbi:Ig-like domain-containing protein [Leeuwenhoekiella nanhaiensis]|uniref:SbsA Ig-like domain-containing protein n=1 Tax=Leeuwenhoekiella nanhaiensis TaxID=1655491 RepID=A0A2G1VW75_9FLAO|nr:Ig-like domain-containing protein [Leeuwenhoekiella nanhaiensis]PHQ30860.1 hypothetical protein CJ305_01120 [Leeuwenhoekiella nanhaiensis]
MFRKGLHVLTALVLLLLVVQCAKKGTPTGGPKDETPPVLVRAEPPNYTTNFNSKEIRIYFDEYIKLKDLSKNLIVSPPMKTPATITPMGGASKYIDIEIMDTLLPNTTYVFNFGESVVDNNEGNPFSFFKYVFSTGDYIDSLTVTGVIRDALLNKPDNYVTVMLYEADSTYTDSLIYKEVPRYVTNTLDSSVVFELTNIKAGRYKLAALKDEASNYTFQPDKDKVAFYDGFIDVPTDSVYVLRLFNEELPAEAGRPKQASAQRVAIPYIGNPDSIGVNLISQKPEGFERFISNVSTQDSLQYWYKPQAETDSLIFQFKTQILDTGYVRLRRGLKMDSLQVQQATSTLILEEPLRFNSTVPLMAVDTSKISIRKKDSTFIENFKIRLLPETLQMQLDFKTAELENYEIMMLPEALTDFYGTKTDTLRFRVNTKEYADYGDFSLTLQNAAPVQHIVQLVTEKGEVKREIIAKEGTTVFEFDRLEPGKYYARIIVDLNKNGRFDSGNYLEQLQPEEVIYYPDLLDIRSNFSQNETFFLTPE